MSAPLLRTNAWTVSHDAEDDVLLARLDDRITPPGLALDLIIFPGGGLVRTRAFWKLRHQRQLLHAQRAARA